MDGVSQVGRAVGAVTDINPVNMARAGEILGLGHAQHLRQQDSLLAAKKRAAGTAFADRMDGLSAETGKLHDVMGRRHEDIEQGLVDPTELPAPTTKTFQHAAKALIANRHYMALQKATATSGATPYQEDETLGTSTEPALHMKGADAPFTTGEKVAESSHQAFSAARTAGDVLSGNFDAAEEALQTHETGKAMTIAASGALVPVVSKLTELGGAQGAVLAGKTVQASGSAVSLAARLGQRLSSKGHSKYQRKKHAQELRDGTRFREVRAKGLDVYSAPRAEKSLFHDAVKAAGPMVGSAAGYRVGEGMDHLMDGGMGQLGQGGQDFIANSAQGITEEVSESTTKSFASDKPNKRGLLSRLGGFLRGTGRPASTTASTHDPAQVGEMFDNPLNAAVAHDNPMNASVEYDNPLDAHPDVSDPSSPLDAESTDFTNPIFQDGDWSAEDFE
jgi:hypothetical protein